MKTIVVPGGTAASAAAEQDAVRAIVGRFSRELEPTARRMVSRYQLSASAPAFGPVVKADAGGPPGPSVR